MKSWMIVLGVVGAWAAQAQESVLARLHRAEALSRPVFSDVRPPDRAERIAEAVKIYEGIVTENPTQKLALWNLAVLKGASGKLDEALQVARKLIKVDPQHRDGLYLIGVLDWLMVGRAISDVRVGTMNSKEQLDEARKKLNASQMPVLDEGLAMLLQATRIDPRFSEAMAWESMLLRRKAQVAETAAQRAEWIAQAGELSKKATEISSTEKKKEPPKIDPAVEPPPLPYPGVPPPTAAGPPKKE